MNVSVAEARNKLTQLLQQVERGERVTICRHGKPIVGLVPANANSFAPRKFGTLKGKIKILDKDWAKPQNDVDAWLKGEVCLRLLLDTHAFLELAENGTAQLAPAARGSIQDTGNSYF